MNAKKILVFAFAGAAAAGVAAVPRLAADPVRTEQTRQVAVSVVTNRIGGTLLDFGDHAWGFLEFTAPAGVTGEYVVVLGELRRSGEPGFVERHPGATIRAARVAGVVAGGGTVRVPLEPDARNTKTAARGGMAVPIAPEHGVIMPFRYAEIVKLPFPAERGAFRRVRVARPFDPSESLFESSNPELDRIYAFCRRTIVATSFAGLYVDGDRERIPYEGDAYVNQLGDWSISSDYAMGRATTAYLIERPTWPTEWRQLSIRMAWLDWMYTGDAALIAKYYDALKNDKLMDRHRRAKDGLLETGGERGNGAKPGAADIVDWPRGERDGFVFRPVNAVVNALHYANLLEMADIALALGKRADAAEFAARAAGVKRAFRAAFRDPERGLYVDGEGTDHASFHANVAAVAFGLVPEDERKGVLNWCLGRGMPASPYFMQFYLQAMIDNGRVKDAVNVMTAKGRRSWFGMMDCGATIAMEAWHPSVKPNLDLGHAWSTAPLNAIVRGILGVTPDLPGFEKIRVRPQFGPLRHLKAKVPTAKGVVRFEYADNLLNLTVPARARFEFPDGDALELEPGTHAIPMR